MPSLHEYLQEPPMLALSPRESSHFIVTAHPNNGLVSISSEGVKRVSGEMLEAVEQGGMQEVDFDAHEMHPKGADRAAIDWIFLIDTINFSFWAEGADHFAVTYHNSTHTGYFAGCACVNRALEEGIPITSAAYMQGVTEREMAHVFRSDREGVAIPLLKERVTVIQEAGRVLLEKFNGSFHNCLLECEGSAQKLLQLVVDNFPSYKDYATFRGQKVSFLKRAQILVADIYGCLRNKDPIGDFKDIGSLTMFADYRVPQALAYMGVLIYSDHLMEQLRSHVLMENGSEEEVIIRAYSIYACDAIAEEVEALAKKKDKDREERRHIYPMDVDMFLWVYRRKRAAEIEGAVPFHRVRCIYY